MNEMRDKWTIFKSRATGRFFWGTESDMKRECSDKYYLYIMSFDTMNNAILYTEQKNIQREIDNG